MITFMVSSTMLIGENDLDEKKEKNLFTCGNDNVGHSWWLFIHASTSLYFVFAVGPYFFHKFWTPFSITKSSRNMDMTALMAARPIKVHLKPKSTTGNNSSKFWKNLKEKKIFGCIKVPRWRRDYKWQLYNSSCFKGNHNPVCI